ANMKAISTMAQKPKTTSTSPSRCQMPACWGWAWASRSKILVEKVWRTASPKRAAPMSWTVVGCMRRNKGCKAARPTHSTCRWPPDVARHPGGQVSSPAGSSAFAREFTRALEQLLAARRQVHHPQVFAGLGIALAQRLERGDGGVVDKAQVLAIERDLRRVVGRIELVQKGRGRGEEQRAVHEVVLAAIGLDVAVGVEG